MNTTEMNDTEIVEMMQTLMNEGLQGFPAVMTRMYNLAMQFERELHLGAGKYERTDDRRGYANGYKPKTLNTHAGKLTLQIPQVRDSETPFYPRSLERGTRYERALKLAVAEMYVRGVSTRKVQAVFDRLCDVNVTADQAKTAVVAYGPIWAIGTGKTATSDQAEEVCGAIRACIKELYDDATGEAIRIQYGGSVNAGNAAELFAKPDIDGGLVGGASLKEEFGKIVNYK